jgi:hypothetical protein
MLLARAHADGSTGRGSLAAGRVPPSADGSARPGVPLSPGTPSTSTESIQVPPAAHFGRSRLVVGQVGGPIAATAPALFHGAAGHSPSWRAYPLRRLCPCDLADYAASATSGASYRFFDIVMGVPGSRGLGRHSDPPPPPLERQDAGAGPSQQSLPTALQPNLSDNLTSSSGVRPRAAPGTNLSDNLIGSSGARARDPSNRFGPGEPCPDEERDGRCERPRKRREAPYRAAGLVWIEHRRKGGEVVRLRVQQWGIGFYIQLNQASPSLRLPRGWYDLITSSHGHMRPREFDGPCCPESTLPLRFLNRRRCYL